MSINNRKAKRIVRAYADDDVIDRNFQPCYVDWCSERGDEGIEIGAGEWREFCPKHAREWKKEHANG